MEPRAILAVQLLMPPADLVLLAPLLAGRGECLLEERQVAG